MNFYSFFRYFAFKFDPELIHEFSMTSLGHAPFLADLFPHVETDLEKYQVQVGRLKWKFPVGLAAGLDKNGLAIDFFSRLGLGAVEIGTVTPKPQEGNPRPRLFRYPKKKSLRNSMGFNNEGAKSVLVHLLTAQPESIVGVNIGKNKSTSAEQAPNDYQLLYKFFAPHADYLVVNVSSPNTPGLRDLQKKEELVRILENLKEERKVVDCPLYVKISPDLNQHDLEVIVEVALQYKLEGLIATNTTIMPDLGPGGISGDLLKEKASATRNKLLQLTQDSSLQVIGVGGISNFDDLLEFWENGGRVVQMYTALIYHGPEILAKFSKEIDKCLKKNKVKNVEDLLKKIQRK